ncbi:lysine-rich nucleolar protein 1 isoform X2 [Cynocephalus volans]|uniref:lysine-rich nucleolar protein 1 isoform X2 n=1 Tax=Cynocephalus volans TaxID=110931 RepID=UPI002FCB1C30
MITRTHKVDLGLGLLEKKKKKVVKEPETQYSILKNNDYFADACPVRATSPSKNVAQGQAPEILLVKKRKKKKGHSTLYEEHLESETTLCIRQTEKSPSPRKQALGHLEYLTGEKKKKRQSLLSPAVSHGSGMKTSPDPRQSEEVARAGKELKKRKKEKKAQDTAAFSVRDPLFCEAKDALSACPVGKEGEDQAALGQKRKQGTPRDHSGKMKKKKKIHQERDTLLVSSKLSSSVNSSPRKGSKKKPVKVEAPEYIPIGDGHEAPIKKMKSKKKGEQPVIEELPLKRKKKKKKESRVAGDPWKEVRRKALQEEIDRESGKTEASESRKWTGTRFGQWDTASFEDDQQKLKFLKLMGGFKNLSPSFSHPPRTTGRPNMALSKKAADTLQQNLQQDYDRAMSWKYNRGAGLGFSTAPNKIFYIDRNASKSIKLED